MNINVNAICNSLASTANQVGHQVGQYVDGQATGGLLSFFSTGNVVCLVARWTGRPLQIVAAHDGRLIVDGLGTEGPQAYNAHWTVVNEGNNIIRLHNNSNYLCINNSQMMIIPQVAGVPVGSETKLRISQHTNSHVIFESVKEPGRFVTINRLGQPVPGAVDATTRHFMPKLLSRHLWLKLVLVLLVRNVHTTDILTKADVDEMVQYIREELYDVPTMLGGLVRLGFHDCVGRCDGCIQYSNPSNDGLERYIKRIDHVWDTVLSKGLGPISRADFWILAYQTAILVGCENIPDSYPHKALPHDMVFKYGRKDHQGACPDRYFPSAKEDPVVALYELFGLTIKEAVALMGAHTVGKAHYWASGYRFPWTAYQHWFDNEYFITLYKKKWYQLKIRKPDETTGHQWMRQIKANRYLMLHCDMILYLNVTIPYGETKSTCVYPNLANDYETGCEYSYYRRYVREFAKSNQLFIKYFVRATDKVTSYGYEGELKIPQ